MPSIELMITGMLLLLVLTLAGTIGFGLFQLRHQRATVSGTKVKKADTGQSLIADLSPPSPQPVAEVLSTAAPVLTRLTQPFPSGGYLPQPIQRGILPPPAPSLRDNVLQDAQQKGGLAPSPQPTYREVVD